VLLVEDSRFIAKLVRQSVERALGREVIVAGTLAEAVSVADEEPARLLAAVVDLDLPDAPHGEVVAAMVGRGVPTVVLTATYDEATRERILDEGIVDYYIKGDQSLAQVNETLRRLERNPEVKVLVVDDSGVYRRLLVKLLRTHRFAVVEARDGVEALDVLATNPDTMLIVTDFEMPRCDGIELVRRVREKHRPETLAILGASSLGSSVMSARFLKHGADDFLTKPFLAEELYCRVYHAVRTLEHIREIRRAAYTDQLTRLDNRLSFFTTVPPLWEAAREVGRDFTVAMVDIDHFKSINDTHGHAGGDAALRHVADLLRRVLAAEGLFVARFGGEEFCVVGDGVGGERAADLFEALRAEVEGSSVAFEGATIRFTLSVGATARAAETLDGTINAADEALYDAKEGGRNRVVFGA
jgi:diguanylate cyclase (GGDEF)-like protein